MAALKKKQPSQTKVKGLSPAAAAHGAMAQPGLPALAPNLHVASYRGAVAVKPFMGWLLVVLLVMAVGGFLAAQLLINQRASQLVADTAARVALQAQYRGDAAQNWLSAQQKTLDSVAQADLMRLWMSDQLGTLSPDVAFAVRAQTPYIEQLLADMLRRHGFAAVHVLAADGSVLKSQGPLPANLVEAQVEIADIAKTARGRVLPARTVGEVSAIDILRPIVAMEGNATVGTPAVLGVVWGTLPLPQALETLTAAQPLDRPGERTTLLQSATEGSTLAVLGRTAQAPLGKTLDAARSAAAEGRHAVPSVIDNAPVFAKFVPLEGSPLVLLQEYRASSALELLNLYKPGLYTVVSLLVLVLGALMLTLILHLMGQRNNTRVKLLSQTMEALVRVVEARDPYLAGHHARVARVALAVANAMRIGVGERATLYYAAQLSAVGRLLVPREILGKKSSYTPAERDAMQSHMAQAITILGDLDFDLPIIPVIGQMYERVDGSGYPNQLRGHQMHTMAKILGAADAFAAMTADRAHRKALTKTEALKQMGTGAYDETVLA
ncbi:MAG: HD-GYP domain-containing protein, partial [Pseudomonadota bacterium]